MAVNVLIFLLLGLLYFFHDGIDLAEGCLPNILRACNLQARPTTASAIYPLFLGPTAISGQ